jgi:hypothetical protein
MTFPFRPHKQKNIYTFNDDVRTSHVCSTNIPHIETSSRCWWDHHVIKSTKTICKELSKELSKELCKELSKELWQCPISFKPHTHYKSIKTAKCNIDIIDSVTMSSINEHGMKSSQLEMGSMTMIGVFCSAPCVLAWIIDKKHDAQYHNSQHYLSVMVGHKMFEPAPHWSCINAYGGQYSIDEFRSISGIVHHVDWGFAVRTASWLSEADTKHEEKKRTSQIPHIVTEEGDEGEEETEDGDIGDADEDGDQEADGEGDQDVDGEDDEEDGPDEEMDE